MLLGILLVLTISTVFGQDAQGCASAVTTFSTCLATNALQNKDYCDCWNNFKDQASKTCVSSDQISNVYAQCALAKAGCSSVDCSSFNPGNCAGSITSLPLCVAQAAGDKSKECNCLGTFVSQTNNYCTDAENVILQVATCQSMEAELNCGQNCKISGDQCDVVNQLIPNCQANFTSCEENDCDCYDAFNGCMQAFQSCSSAQQTTVKACVERQFGCSSIQGHCDDDIETPVSISDLDDLFKNYNSKFIALWNDRLSNWTAAVQTCTHVASASSITWTVTVTYNDTKYTIHDILTAIIDEFSNTVGVKASQLTGAVKDDHKKRDIQSSTGTVTVTATSQGNGSSMVSVFLLPIVLFNGLMFLLFH